jgi:predicted peroxiredoxin
MALSGPPTSEMLCASDESGRKAMKITYFVSAGIADATRASIPLHLAANGSVEVGQETSIILGGDAAELLLGDNLDRVEGVGVPPARELLAKLRDHEVPVYIWKGCAVARGATDDDLQKVNGSWVTPPDVARLFAASDRVVTF